MIGIDTNVLVRHLVQDDPIQGPQATAWLDANCGPARPGYVDRVVLAELVWVLGRACAYPQDQIAALVDDLLRTAELVVDATEEARRALTLYRTTGIDFADALIGALHASAGCARTVTFDRRAGRAAGFTLLREGQ